MATLLPQEDKNKKREGEGIDFRHPKFSQAPIWLPTWLISSSPHSGVNAFDTPSLFASIYKDSEDSSGLEPENENSTSASSKFACERVLFLSEDDANHLTCNGPIKEFSLHLSLSMEETTTLLNSQDVDRLSNTQCEETQGYKGDGSKDPIALELVPERNIANQAMETPPKACANSNVETMEGRRVGSSQRTVSTELYIPHCMSVNGVTQEESGLEACTVPPKEDIKLIQIMDMEMKPLDEVKRPSGGRLQANESNVGVRKPKAVGKSDSNSENVQAAVGLIVTAAEALVVANIMRSCSACQEFGPSAVLDAGLQLRKGRQQCGLDEFTLESISGIDLACDDDDFSMDLDDYPLEEDLADVGFCQPSTMSNVVTPAENGDSKSKELPSVGSENGDSRSKEVPSEVPWITSRSAEAMDCTGDGDMHSDVPKPFVSRWLGGWTSPDGATDPLMKDKMPARNQMLSFAGFETSSLSEPPDYVDRNAKGKRDPTTPSASGPCFKWDVNGGSQAALPLTASSCVEAVIALSQASMMCSNSSPPPHEPLSSFVPCSLTHGVFTTSTQTCVAVDTSTVARGGLEKQNTGDEEQPDAEKSSGSGIIRRRKLNSLRAFSAVVDSFKTHRIPLDENENKSSFEATIDHGGLLKLHETKAAKNKEHVERKDWVISPIEPDIDTEVLLPCELKKRNISDIEVLPLDPYSDLDDSPALVWCRGRKRRLRACRIVESEITLDADFDETNLKPLPGCQKAKEPLEKPSSTVLPIDCAERLGAPRSLKFPRTVKASESQGVHSKISRKDKIEEIVQFKNQCPEADKLDASSPRVAKVKPNSKQQKSCPKARKPLGKLSLIVSGIDCEEISGGPMSPKFPRTVEVSKSREDKMEENVGLKNQSPEADKIYVSSSRATKVKPNNKCRIDVFIGLKFLITGFSTCERNEIVEKIKEHRGSVLENVPKPVAARSKMARYQECQYYRHPIVIAPQQVRTTKFLYGCAVGSLIVKPTWVDECISTRKKVNLLMPKNEHNLKKGCLRNDGKGCNGLLFKEIHALLCGQSPFCSRLALLVQHGGGRVTLIAKNKIEAKKVAGISLQLLVVEDPLKVARSFKRAAADLNLPILSGDWIVDSLLEGRLLPISREETQLNQDTSTQKRHYYFPISKFPRRFLIKARNIEPNPGKHGCGTDSSTSLKKRISLPSSSSKPESSLQRKKNTLANNGLGFSFVGEGSLSPPVFNEEDVATNLFKVAPVTSTNRKTHGKCVYYSGVNLDGAVFSSGDIVEVQPYTEGEKYPYIAQIRSFSVVSSCQVAKGGPVEDKKKMGDPLMQCRWFYRPSETGFSSIIGGNENEVFLSNHIDTDVPIKNILRKALIKWIVDKKPQDSTEKIPRIFDPLKVFLPKAGEREFTHYVCRFFYDHVKESLHHLKDP